MKAMLLERQGNPLRMADLPVPKPAPGQVLLKAHACGVCRTDLHVLDGDLKEPKLPLVLGHQIVGTVVELGLSAVGIEIGMRVGVPWLGWTCGTCEFCSSGQENLCEQARFTGYHLDGGFAEYAVADARYCFPIPENVDSLHAAPLLCAGLIGHRALRMAGDAKRIGLFGFGASAHLVAQVARFRGREVYAFTRALDLDSQRFALSLGAIWAGSSDEMPPVSLDAAIIFAAVGGLVPTALKSVRKGGTVVCAGIHMSDIPAFPYELLWGERTLRSVANLTRQDGLEFMDLAAKAKLQTHIQPYALERANEALEDLRAGRLNGAAVLHVS